MFGIVVVSMLRRESFVLGAARQAEPEERRALHHREELENQMQAKKMHVSRFSS